MTGNRGATHILGCPLRNRMPFERHCSQKPYPKCHTIPSQSMGEGDSERVREMLQRPTDTGKIDWISSVGGF